MKKISLLGSSGSVGVQTLDVVRASANDDYEISGLLVYSDIDTLYEQIIEFSPIAAGVVDEKAALELKQRLLKHEPSKKTQIIAGKDAALEIASLSETNVVVNAIVGKAGLLPTMRAIAAKKNIALANKETLVCAGEIVMKAAREAGVSIIPVDSEHSAIFQCLQGNEQAVERIYLTASGGPFRQKTAEQLKEVTLKDALKHPNWEMGKKITIDSATLMNKGLEVIEARWLFDLPLSQIEVLVHPQSIIHSMVGFIDGAVLAQLGLPDMRVPIQYALTFPKRLKNDFERLNFLEKNTFTFEMPREDLFPCLKLAKQALLDSGNYPAVLNAANEAAVSLFLQEKIKFTDIPALIESAMSAYNVNKVSASGFQEISGYQYADEIRCVLAADDFARRHVFEKA